MEDIVSEKFNVNSMIGVVTMWVYNTGNPVHLFHKKNLIVRSMAKGLAGILSVQTEAYPHYIKLGQSSVAPSLSQIDLVEPIGALEIDKYEITDSTNTATVYATGTPGIFPNGVYREMGLFSGDSKMLSRVMISPEVFLDESTSFRVRWDIQFT